jgi:uncharacterized protein with HEPN domain
MSKKRNTVLLLTDILNAIEAIEEYLLNFSEDAFYRDRKTKDAVVRNFEIIGEASRQLPAEVKLLYPDIDWRKITDLRNRIIHEYFGVDYVLIWEIVELDLPAFKQKIQAIISTFPDR